MQVKIQYTSEITIDGVTLPIYITDESCIYVGMEIMQWVTSKHEIRGLIITDVDDMQYNVYPFVEVCKFILRDVLIELNTESIEKKEHKIIEKKEQSEFVLTLKNISKPKGKGK